MHAELIEIIPPEVVWPSGFDMRADGLFYIGDRGAVRVCAPFEVKAETRDPRGEGWGLLVEWLDADGRRKQRVLRRADFLGEARDAIAPLADGGLRVQRHALLQRALNEVSAVGRATLATRPGWIGTSYALGAEVFAGPEAEPVAFEGEARFDLRGTLEGWRERVAGPALGNSRVVGAISLAFLGPVLGLLGAEGFGLHLRGASSVGKTTALRAAASVWGVPVGTWRATGNGLEAIAAAANDGFLALDELGQVDAREAGEIAYLLANGSGKARAARSGGARDRASWRVTFLSTGEIGLADKAAEAGPNRRVMAGQEVRLLDVPADAGEGYGLFDTVHGTAGGAALSAMISRGADAHRGVAIRGFLDWLAKNRTEAVDASAAIRKAFASLLTAGADGQTQRAAEKFALIATAGELATAAEVTGWPPGEAIHAARILFDAWRAARGGDGPREAQDAIATVRGFIERFQLGRFEQDGGGTDVRDRVGFVAEVRGERAFCFFAEVFRREVIPGRDPKAAARHLADAGLLIADAERLTARVRHRGQLLGVYCVRAAILEVAT